ncbi:UNVERIFIED_CONTAM: hypothetical protein Sangu_0598600 [Sesamum angustifolium]|uniref:PORR domain-containing protein n=1 Tax=Sesamum angustifolium TaxID=2727405 RepID=A0AAW2QBC1_9LAMI
MPPLLHFPTTAHHHLRHRLYLHQSRTFINARIKWVRDPYLDTAVDREKNLKPLLSLKTLILSQPSQTLSLSTISPLKPQLHLPTAAEKFIRDYPLIFKIFLPPNRSNSLPHVKLTPKLLSLHHDEMLILSMSHYRKDVAERLAKLLMLTRARKLPLYLIDMIKYDLGLPDDYLLTLLLEFPDYFQICDMGFRNSCGDAVLGLELVSWRDELAVSEMDKRARREGESGTRIKCSMTRICRRGLDVEWLEIIPYENPFHTNKSGGKWAVGGARVAEFAGFQEDGEGECVLFRRVLGV